MATSKEYVAYILDQLSLVNGIISRMMMGEYLIYHHGKIAAYLCDGRLLVKILPSTKELLPEAPIELPYKGGKPMLLVENVDDMLFLRILFETMYPELPELKKKKSGIKGETPC